MRPRHFPTLHLRPILAVLFLSVVLPSSSPAEEAGSSNDTDTTEEEAAPETGDNTEVDEGEANGDDAATPPDEAAPAKTTPTTGASAPTEAAEPAAPTATAAPTAAPTPRVGYEKGFFIASPDDRFKLVINGRIQARFTYENTDGDPRSHKAQFSIPRARLKLGGHAFDERFAFALQLDFGKGDAGLKDAYVDIGAVGHWLRVQVGQFKRPFSRQQITSSGKLHFVDRAITDAYFQGGRDLGLVLHSHSSKAPIEYSVGVFNGTGDKGLLKGDVVVDPATSEGEITSGKFSNVPDLVDPMAVVRLGWHSRGFDGYSESDTKGSDFGIGVAASALVDFDSDQTYDSAIRAELDYVLKWKGLSHTGAVYVATAQDGEAFSDQDFDAVGFHLQAGYVIKGLIEPVVRYARILPKGDDNDSQEILGGVNVFCHGHNIKWTTDFGVLTFEAEGDAIVDFRAQTQLQLAF